MRITMIILTLLAVTGALAYGLTGTGATTVEALFTAEDVQSGTSYPAGFSGVPWSTFDPLHLGLGGSYSQEGELAAHGSSVFVLVHGTWDGDDYTGLIRYDGSDLENLVQDRWVWGDPASGSQLVGVVVPRVSEGTITAGHPIVARGSGPEDGHYYMELWSIDPTTSPAGETLLHRWADPSTSSIQLAVDGEGRIFALNGGALRRLTWDGSGWDESFLSVPSLDYGLAVGADDSLMSLPADVNWGGVKPPTTAAVLRIDPDTGASSTHASIELKGGFFRGFAWDSDGQGWIALRDSRNRSSYVIPLDSGDSIDDRSARDRIVEASSGSLRNLTAGTNGELYALAWDAPDTVYRINPGTGGDDGGGGGGGGKGGGKGKNK